MATITGWEAMIIKQEQKDCEKAQNKIEAKCNKRFKTTIK